jgi:hypothetical protein
MKIFDHYLMRRALAVLTTGLALGGIFAPAARANMYRQDLNEGGGIPGTTTITPTYGTNTVTFSWYGMRCWQMETRW